MKTSVLFLSFILSSIATSVLASEKIQVRSMTEVSARLAELSKSRPASEILVIFDIDNTVLTTKKDLGGDAWFTWQEGKLKNKEATDLVSSSFEGLLSVQGVLFSAGAMFPPEAGTPDFIKSLQQKGHPLFALTSRGFAFQNATQKELARAGYQFSATAIGPKGGVPGQFDPFDFVTENSACLNKSELTEWGVPAGRPTVYTEGVVYSSGGHKGAVLRALLCRFQKTFPVIVFVDDTEKHSDRVLKSFSAQKGVEVLAFRYGAMDDKVENFNRSDKREAIESWEKIKSVLKDTLDVEFN